MTTLIAAKGLTVSGPPYVMPAPILSQVGPDKGICLDPSHPQCFVRQATPVNADPLVNLSNSAFIRNGSVTMAASAGITYAGGGFSFAGVVEYLNYVGIANAFEAIQADANKEWSAVGYVKFPAIANYPASGFSGGLCAAGPYASAPDLFTLYLNNNAGTKGAAVRIQTVVGTTVALGQCPIANFAGKWCQVLILRKGGVATWRVKTLDGVYTFQDGNTTVATNSATLSGLTWRWGLLDNSMTAYPAHSAGANWTGSSTTSNDPGVCQHTFGGMTIQSAASLANAAAITAIADADFANVVALSLYS
jgi:hypothetical protein